MSHEITERDGLVLTGTPAWHGLGTVVADAPSPAEALRIAGLGWSVERVPLFMRRKAVTVDADGSLAEQDTEQGVESHVANVRQDTGEILGVVGSGYSVVQNRDLVGLIYDAARSEGVKIESAGSLRAGRDVFFLAHLDTFQIGQRDRSHLYALFANGHDGGRALSVLPTSVRVVCANTLRLATSKEADSLTVTLRHTNGMAERLDDVRACLRGAAAVAEREADKARSLAERTMSPTEVAAFFGTVYAKMYGEIPTGDTRGDKGKRTRAREMAESWARTLRTETDALALPVSAWTAANAVTRWIDHERGVRGDRNYANLFGGAADAKADVFASALALIDG